MNVLCRGRIGMTQMTRKQALSRTIEILNNLKTQDTEEIKEEIKTLTHAII